MEYYYGLPGFKTQIVERGIVLKILFASDMSFNYIKEIPDKELVERLMSEASNVFEKSDFSIVNLENVFGSNQIGNPIIKSGPNLISDDSYIEYINIIKPTVIGLANNHAGDFGDEALFHTVDMLEENGYKCIGAGRDIAEAYRPAIFEKDGVIVAVFAICENEFGIADDESAGAAGYNLTMVTNAILSAKENGFMPIIYFHGGNEHNPFPSPGKVELYRHFIDLGASAVIAMHTHCPQGYELYKECPIVYSMGNFYFPSDQLAISKSWNYGYMTVLDISKLKISIEIMPYKFDFGYHNLLSGAEKNNFLKYIEYISRPIKQSKLLKEYFDSWCIISGLNNYVNHVTVSKEMLSDGAKALRHIKNIFSCEAHNELINNTIRIIFEGRYDNAKIHIDEIKRLQNMDF